MSDNPNKIIPVLLENLNDEQKVSLLEGITDACNTYNLQKNHSCWTFIPSQTEYDRMKKYREAPNYDKCPKCGKGRVILQFHHGNIGESIFLVCRWGDKECKFKEYISDEE